MERRDEVKMKKGTTKKACKGTPTRKGKEVGGLYLKACQRKVPLLTSCPKPLENYLDFWPPEP